MRASELKTGSPRRVTASSALTAVGLAAAHALLLVAAFPPYNLWAFVLLAPLPLAWLARQGGSMAVTLLAVHLTQVAMWLWLQRWMWDVTVVGYPALCCYLALFPTLWCWLFRRVSLHPALGKLPTAIVLPVTWVGVEFVRGELAFNGYPWFLLGHPLAEAPLAMQSADLLGAYFISFLTAMAAGMLVDLGRVFTRSITPRWGALVVVVVAGVWCGNLVYGYWRLEQHEPLTQQRLNILAIQTNLPQSNKNAWTLKQQAHDLVSFLQQTVDAHDARTATGTRIDMIVWPETMMPGFGLDEETLTTLRRTDSDYARLAVQFAESLQAVAAALGVPMLIGSPAYEELRPGNKDSPWDRHYNSAYLMQPDGSVQRADKSFLTPFGETMPYISRWKWLERQLLALGAEGMSFELDAAGEVELLHHPPGTTNPTTIGVPICFEATVAGVCRRMAYQDGLKRADLFINISNDGWFGANDEGREQHAQIARFRCVENRMPMVRCVNTGCSVLIDSNGKLPAVVGDGRYGKGRVEAALLAEVQLDRRQTLYGRIGETWAWMCLAGTLILLPLTWRRQGGADNGKGLT
jgi:apolipoprotein N-acyltransferase